MTTLRPARYYEMLRHYQEAQLLFTSIRLNLFSYLDEWITAHEISRQSGYSAHALEYVLLALSSSAFIQNREDLYKNTVEGKQFLSRHSPLYIGETLLFREQMTSLEHLDASITGDKREAAVAYDFAKLAELVVPEMYATGRVESFLTMLDKLFPSQHQPMCMLDVGGGSGIFAIEFVKKYTASTAIVFEHPTVAPICESMIRRHRVEQVSVQAGDFNKDEFGGPYDLVIASGILDFAKQPLDHFIMKLSDAIKPEGFLLLVGQYADEAKRNVLGWLSGYINGLSLPPERAAVEQSMAKAGLQLEQSIPIGRFTGMIMKKERNI